MLVLRKEIKIGIGAGLTIIGIAGVYGLMASLSSSGDHKDLADGSNVPAVSTASDVSAEELAKRQKAISDALNGGGKTDDSIASNTKTPDVVATGTDPFSESKRTDGNKSDIWASALTTGKITGDVKKAPAVDNSDATVVKAPSKADSKLVQLTPPVDSGATSTESTTDTSTKVASKPKAQTKSAGGDSAVATAGGSKYVIKPGDTFSTISEKFYGSRKYFNVLVKANPDINPSKMKVGHEITVPSKEAVASIGGAVSEDVKLTTPIDASKQYRVAPGDTLSRISQKLYGTSNKWQAIYEANQTLIGPNEAKLKVGMLLELPAKPVR